MTASSATFISAALLLVSSLLASPTLARAQDELSGQREPVVRLTPSVGDFNAIARIPISISGRSMLVGSSWTQVVYEFQLTPEGDWQQVSILSPGVDSSDITDAEIGFGSLVDHANGTAAVVGGYGYKQDKLTVLERDSSGAWNVQKAFDTFSITSFSVDSTGSFIAVYGPRYELEEDVRVQYAVAQIYSKESGWELIAEHSVATDLENRLYNPSAATCIHDDTAIAGPFVFTASQAGSWSLLSQLPFFPTSMHGSVGCEVLRYYDYGAQEWRVFELDVSGNASETEAQAPYDQFNEQYAIREYRLAAYYPYQEIYERNSDGQWNLKGFLDLGANFEHGRYEAQLIGSLLIVATPSPAELTVYDLAQLTLPASAIEPQEECHSGISDPDGDGYGWEDDEVCIVPADYIPHGDSQQSLYVDIDRSIPKLPGQPLAMHEHTAILPVSAASPESIDLAVYKNEGDAWRLMQTLPLTTDYLRVVEEEFGGEPPFSDQINGTLKGTVEVDIHANTMVVGLPNSDVQDTKYGVVLVYERDAQDSWAFKSMLTRPDNVWIFAEFGSRVAVSNDLIVVRNGIWGGYGSSPGGIHTYKKNAAGDWVLLNQLWDTRQPGGSPAFGLGMALEGNTLMAGNANYSAANSVVEVFELMSTGEWSHQQLLPADRHWEDIPYIDIRSNTAAVVEGGKLRLFFKDENNRWHADTILSGGRFFVDAGMLWSSDEPLVPERNERVEWERNQNYYPVAYTTQGLTQGGESPGTTEPTDDASTINDDAGSSADTASVTPGDEDSSGSIASSNNSNGGSGVFSMIHLLLLMLVSGYFMRNANRKY